jgi:Protein of unknown function (DUF2510)
MSVQPVQQPIRPARVWYLVAGALMVGAVVWLVAGVVLGLGSFVRQVDRFQRVPIPGQGEVRFDEPGRYTVYYEGPAAGDETVAIPSFRLSVVPVGGGQELTVRPYEGASLYTSGNHSGRAVGTVQIDQPGKYLLRTEGEPQVIQAHVAVGEEIGSNLGLRAIPIVLLLLFGGAVLAVVVAVRRQQARRGPPTLATWGQGALPAGWLADPGRRHELRYWDGQRWTEHVSDRGTQGIDPM